MTLRYDFDIVPVFEDIDGAEPAPGDAQELGRACLALFRDPDTVAALKAAPDGLRLCLEASGFGLAAHECALPDGRYDAAEEEQRLALIGRLAERLPHADLQADDLTPGAAKGAFDFAAFLDSLDAARPMEQVSDSLLPAPGVIAEEVASDSPETISDPDALAPAPAADLPETSAPKDDPWAEILGDPVPEAPLASRDANADAEPEDTDWTTLIAQATADEDTGPQAPAADPAQSAREDDQDAPGVVPQPGMDLFIGPLPALSDPETDASAGADTPPSRRRPMLRVAACVTVLAGVMLTAPLVMDHLMPLIETNVLSAVR